MQSEQPLVSIILPVFNNSRFLPACLESLSQQTYRNIEVIAIDDASKDESFAILKAAKQQDKRFRIFRNIKHYGLAVTLNRAVRKARGVFIAFASPNDTSAKNRIKRQIHFLLAQPKVAAVGTQCYFVNKKSQKVGKSAFPLEHHHIRTALLAGLSVQPETLILRRVAIPKDAIRFRHTSYPLIYTEVFARCMQYSQFTNLSAFLYKHRKTSYTSPHALKVLPSLVRSWIEAATFSNQRMPLRSLFFPLVRT